MDQTASPSHWLERRIPPPVVALGCAILMWLFTPAGLPRGGDAIFLVLTGAAVSSSALGLFVRAKTNFHPQHDDASCLVTWGPYCFSRNPMYLGLLLILTGWAIMLGPVWTLFGPLLCQLYLTRFQIMPEEQYLQARFGKDSSDHLRRIPRWL